MNDIAILEKFEMLPKKYSNKEVTVNFQNGKWHGLDASTCENIGGLESGNTVEVFAEIKPSPCGHYYRIFAVGDIADKILAIQDGTQITVRA